MRSVTLGLLLLAGLALGQTIRLGIALEGQLLPLGVAGFAEYRTYEGGLARLQVGYDYLGPYALGELGFVLEDRPWRRSWASFGGGYYLEGERDPFAFLLAGAGAYDYGQSLGYWGGVMLPLDSALWDAELGSGGGLALFALLRVRVELAELELR